MAHIIYLIQICSLSHQNKMQSKRLQELFNTSTFPENAFFLNKALANKPVILYGAGESAHWFVEIVMSLHGIKPVVVLDRQFTTPTTFMSVPAIHPEQFQADEYLCEHAVVVIACGKPEHEEEIVYCLKRIGLKHYLFLKQIYEIHNPFSSPPELPNEGFNYYLKHKHAITSAFELLQDELSREVYLSFLQTHMQRVPIDIPRRPREEQYLPLDVPLTKGPQRFLCCGAYDGDVLRSLIKKYGKLEEVVCFEADQKIFSRLANYVNLNKDDIAERIFISPCAVYSHHEIKSYTEASGLGSRLSKEGTLKVQTVALDMMMPLFKPTLVTMDIEGAELDALKGMESIIREAQPDLAVCVYHSPNHIWEIIRYIDSLERGYRFYLRNYTSFTIETVLYATL